MKRFSKRQLQSIIFLLVVIIIFLLNQTFFEKLSSDIKSEDVQSGDILKENIGRVLVSRVIDGDTLKIKIGEKEDTVRLIGINTPESVDPRTTVECFGIESSDRMTELVEGKEVLVAKDPTQSERDKYNRLLAYVYLTDGTLLNQKMIEKGYAFEYTHIVPYEFQTEFKEAESEAREKGLGLWDRSVCDYTSTLKKPSSKVL